MNKVFISGHLTADPVVRYTPAGAPLADITIAVNHSRKKDGEFVDEVTFVDVTVWGKTAEVITERLSKGSKVMVQGRLRVDQWQTHEGVKRRKMSVVSEQIEFFSSGKTRPDDAKAEVMKHEESKDLEEVPF